MSVTSGVPHDVTSPKLVSSTMPDYAAALRSKRLEGRILLEVSLDRRGRVERIRIISSEIPELNDSTIEAVSSWSFQPARRRNESIPISFKLSLKFYLE